LLGQAGTKKDLAEAIREPTIHRFDKMAIACQQPLVNFIQVTPGLFRGTNLVGHFPDAWVVPGGKDLLGKKHRPFHFGFRIVDFGFFGSLFFNPHSAIFNPQFL